MGYVWALAYVFGHQWLEAWFAMPSLLALSLSELVLTFLLIFVHLRFLSRTWLNKVPAVFAAVATVFAAGGIQHLPLCALSAVIGISMAVGTKSSSSGWSNNRKTTLPNRCRVVFSKNLRQVLTSSLGSGILTMQRKLGA